MKRREDGNILPLCKEEETMGNWKTYLLILVALLLVVVIVLTWGSLGSAVCMYGLITMGAALLYKRFLINRDAEDYQMED